MSVQVIHTFVGQTEGQQPAVRILQGQDGNLYGTTLMDGQNGAGTMFRCAPDGTGFTPIRSFEASPSNPGGLVSPSALIQTADGWLYGATQAGGDLGLGSIFRVKPDGTGYSVLHSFTRKGGYQPSAALTQGRDGALYGTTQFGGSTGAGTFFRINTDGSGYTQLHTFGVQQGDPASPQAQLIQGFDGAFYGVTAAGGSRAVAGASGYGTVFRINADGTGRTVLHSFPQDESDGIRPNGALVQDSNGFLYGTAQEGASSGTYGIVFRLNPDGSGYTVVHRFTARTADGAYPNSGLTLAADGSLYGTTEFGGSANSGVVFRLSTDGSRYDVISSLGGETGANPKAALTLTSDGAVVGTASFGGSANSGTIFRLQPVAAYISSIKPLDWQTVQLLIQGTPEVEYVIEASEDRVTWEPLGTVASSDGKLHYEDRDAGQFPRRFYRAAQAR